jgi:hypothetical protein
LSQLVFDRSLAERLEPPTRRGTFSGGASSFTPRRGALLLWTTSVVPSSSER